MALSLPGASVSTSVNGDGRSFLPILRLFREKFLSNECSISVPQRNEINYAFFGQHTLWAQQLCELKLMLSERERGWAQGAQHPVGHKETQQYSSKTGQVPKCRIQGQDLVTMMEMVPSSVLGQLTKIQFLEGLKPHMSHQGHEQVKEVQSVRSSGAQSKPEMQAVWCCWNWRTWHRGLVKLRRAF